MPRKNHTIVYKSNKPKTNKPYVSIESVYNQVRPLLKSNPDIRSTELLTDYISILEQMSVDEKIRRLKNPDTGLSEARMLFESLLPHQRRALLEERAMHEHSADSQTGGYDGGGPRAVSTTPSTYTVNFLLVGGGGAAVWNQGIGNESGNGGSGGQVLSGSNIFSSGTKYVINVGTGGAAGTESSNGNSYYGGTDGSNSNITNFSTSMIIASAIGGWSGQTRYGQSYNVNAGGEGGMIGTNGKLLVAVNARHPGTNPYLNSSFDGTDGITSNITGTVTYYAGGGGAAPATYGPPSGNPGLGIIGAGATGQDDGCPGGTNGVIILAIPTAKFNASGVSGASLSSGWPTVGSNTIVTWNGNGYYIA